MFLDEMFVSVVDDEFVRFLILSKVLLCVWFGYMFVVVDGDIIFFSYGRGLRLRLFGDLWVFDLVMGVWVECKL